MKKSHAFGIAAMLLPLVLLLLLEGGLRLAGVAASERAAFTSIPTKPDHVALNPAYVQRYFRGFRPAVAFDPFRRAKAPGTFRVFVLGGSSAAGFPYQFYNGFPARLGEQLEAAALDRPVEVINLGMTAVNSYTLWDLAEAVVAHDPDAVLIYAGHNEYYGAFGVGSAMNAWNDWIWLKRLHLRLKRTVLYTLLERLLLGGPGSASDGDDRTMMARVVRNATITFGGATYEAGLDQFAANMGAVLATFREAGVPVYLGTLTANLKDQPPLGNQPDALAAFEEGRTLLVRGDTAAARAAFTRARDLDDIRFRAPTVLNEQLRDLASQPGVTLVDVEAAFRRHSPGSLEGDALFTDHLHPTYEGYALMADAFFEALRGHPALAADGLPPAILPPARLDPIEAAHASLQISRLKAGYPFQKERSPAEEQQAFRAILQERLASGQYADSLAIQVLTQQQPMSEALRAGTRRARAQGDTLAALQLYRALLYWQPFNAPLMQEAVAYAASNPAYDARTGQLALHAAQRTGDLDHYNTLAATLLRRARLEDAARVLDVVEARDADSPPMLYNQARLLLMQGDTARARTYFLRYRATQP